MEERVNLTGVQAELLAKVERDRVAAWREILKKFEIIQQALQPYVRLEGHEPDVFQVKRQLEDFLRTVDSNDVVIKGPGVLGYALSNQGKTQLSTIQRSQNVIIKPNIEKSPAYTKIYGDIDTYDVSRSIQIKVGQRKLTSVNIGAIAFPTNTKLRLEDGESGRDILAVGGMEIQDECNILLRRNNGADMPSGKCYETRSGNLRSCSHILHAVEPLTSQHSPDDVIEDLLKDCLSYADKLGVASLALPLDFNYPTHKLAATLWTVVTAFSASKPGSGLKEIQVLDMNALRLHQCNKTLKEKTTGGQVQAAGPAGNFVYDQTKKELKTNEGITVEVFEGSIVDVVPGVDAIVNSISANLNLNQSEGTLAAAVLKFAGKEVQVDIQRRRPQGLQVPGDMVYSERRNIPAAHCRYDIYHFYLTKWDGQDAGPCMQALNKAITTALETADQEQRASIAIPALASGVLGVPMDKVVNAMFDNVTRFSAKHPKNLKRVVLVAYDKNPVAIDAFKKKYQEEIKKANVRRAEPWTFDVAPQNFELCFSITGSSEPDMMNAETALKSLFSDVTPHQHKLDSVNQPTLSHINNDKAKALQALQYTHQVRITLTKANNTLQSMIVQGFEDNVKSATRDALAILEN